MRDFRALPCGVGQDPRRERTVGSGSRTGRAASLDIVKARRNEDRVNLLRSPGVLYEAREWNSSPVSRKVKRQGQIQPERGLR
jgi:hypothetical protein